jgi:hypothetical protein
MCSFCWEIKGNLSFLFVVVCNFYLFFFAELDRMQVPNGGSVPAEFDSLVGTKMLFIIDKGFNQSKIMDGSFRVKRVCVDSQIIQRFLAEGPFITPVKVLGLLFF